MENHTNKKSIRAIVLRSSTHLARIHFMDVLHWKNRPDPFEGYHPLRSLTPSLTFKRRGCALYSVPPFRFGHYGGRTMHETDAIINLILLCLRMM